MSRRHRSLRPGFTLLEIILATAISLLLFGALYFALDTHLRHVQAGREAVEESVLARSLLVRIGNDVSASLPPVVPPKTSSSSSSGSGSGSSTAPSTSKSGSSSSPTSGSTSGSASSSSSSSSSTSGTSSLSGPVQFNYGLQGDSNRLVVYTSRFPRELDGTVTTAPVDGSTIAPPLTSDLRRVTYWLVGGGSDRPLGLARQEVKLATSDDLLNAVPPDVADEASFVIAEEVRSLQFRFFDGSSWVESWDGTVLTSDGRTPRGPPLAVEIVLGVIPAGTRQGPDAPAVPTAELKYYRHVVAIATALVSSSGQP